VIYEKKFLARGGEGRRSPSPRDGTPEEDVKESVVLALRIKDRSNGKINGKSFYTLLLDRGAAHRRGERTTLPANTLTLRKRPLSISESRRGKNQERTSEEKKKLN